MSDPVRIVRLRVRPARVECEVQLAPTAPHRTTPALAARACIAFPDLPHHACANAVGPTFATVMNDTPLPHLLEHLAISCQVRAVAAEGAAHAGEKALAKGSVANGSPAPTVGRSAVGRLGDARGAGQAGNAHGVEAGGVVRAGDAHGVGARGVVRADSGSAKSANAVVLDEVFVGTSEWIDEPAGRALIQLSFTDDLIALRALNQAVAALNTLLSSRGMPPTP